MRSLQDWLLTEVETFEDCSVPIHPLVIGPLFEVLAVEDQSPDWEDKHSWAKHDEWDIIHNKEPGVPADLPLALPCVGVIKAGTDSYIKEALHDVADVNVALVGLQRAVLRLLQFTWVPAAGASQQDQQRDDDYDPDWQEHRAKVKNHKTGLKADVFELGVFLLASVRRVKRRIKDFLWGHHIEGGDINQACHD